MPFAATETASFLHAGLREAGDLSSRIQREGLLVHPSVRF